MRVLSTVQGMQVKRLPMRVSTTDMNLLDPAKFNREFQIQPIPLTRESDSI